VLDLHSFEANAVPAAVFADVSRQDNLDGEALLLGSQLIGGAHRRKKKAKC